MSEHIDGEQLRTLILAIHQPGPVLLMTGDPGCTNCGEPWPCRSALACGLPDTRTPLPEQRSDWYICIFEGCDRERWQRAGAGLLLQCEEHTCRALVENGQQCRAARKRAGAFCGFHIWRSSKQLFTAAVES